MERTGLALCGSLGGNNEGGGGSGGSFTLLPATDTRLGGVKVGENLEIDSEGRLSALVFEKLTYADYLAGNYDPTKKYYIPDFPYTDGIASQIGFDDSVAKTGSDDVQGAIEKNSMDIVDMSNALKTSLLPRNRITSLENDDVIRNLDTGVYLCAFTSTNGYLPYVGNGSVYGTLAVMRTNAEYGVAIFTDTSGRLHYRHFTSDKWHSAWITVATKNELAGLKLARLSVSGTLDEYGQVWVNNTTGSTAVFLLKETAIVNSVTCNIYLEEATTGAIKLRVRKLSDGEVQRSIAVTFTIIVAYI